LRSMPMKPLLVAGLVGLALLQGRLCHAATELEQRAEIKAAAKRSFLLNDFDDLERLAASYRREKSRTASGVWKLSVFYDGINDVFIDILKEQRDVAAYDRVEERTRNWVEKYPESPTGHIAHSMVLAERAWAHRGRGAADTVSDAAWALFRQHIAATRAYLEKHKDVASVDPAWYGEMIAIARDQNWDRAKFDALLEEALDREPLFYQNYFTAVTHLMPRWHGDLQQIEDFAQYAVRKTRHLEGQGMYARIYWYASQMEFKNEIFTNSLADWPQMKAGFDDVISRYPDAWNLNNYARFACMARDKPKAVELLARIGTSVVSEAWVPIGLQSQCAQWSSMP
jgi:hypothetical protein